MLNLLIELVAAPLPPLALELRLDDSFAPSDEVRPESGVVDESGDWTTAFEAPHPMVVWVIG